LESIHLFPHTLSTNWDPEMVSARVLAAPQLRSLIWDFAMYDIQCGYVPSCQHFGPDRADCLCKLAMVAHKEKRALRSVKIYFEPMDARWTLDKMPRTPWELM